MSDAKIENFSDDPASTIKEVIKNPTAMGAAGLGLGLLSEAMVLGDRKKADSPKRAWIIGVSAGAIGFFASSLINAASKKDEKQESWAERIKSKEDDMIDGAEQARHR